MPENNKKKKRFGVTSSAGRFIKLTGMTTSIASKVASSQVKKVFQDEEAQQRDRQKLLEDIGKQVAQTLGEMKGAVMKVGQIASQMQDMLPPEISEALTVLQNSSPPMPWRIIARQIKRELGKDVGELFAEFDEEPFAAASIGQVHKATTLDGRQVVVKVQYPAVKESIDSDLGHLRRIFKLGGLLRVPEEALENVFEEIKQQLNEELDYEQEARHIEEFQKFHADDDFLVIPDVIHDHTSSKVLTLSYEPGDSLDTVSQSSDYSQEVRDLIGSRFVDTFGKQIFIHHAIHGDAHPGNFAFRPDGTIIMYDFGAIKRIPDEDVEAFRRLSLAAIAKDYVAIDAALLELDIRRKNTPQVSSEFYMDWVDLILTAFSEEPFDFASSRLQKDLAKKIRRTSLQEMSWFQPSHKTLLIDRVIGGHYWTLVKLGVHKAFRSNLEHALHARPEG